MVFAKALPDTGPVAANDAIVVTFAATAVDSTHPIMTESLVLVDSNDNSIRPSAMYGPYAEASGSANDWAGVFAPLPAGIYTYKIQVTDTTMTNSDIATGSVTVATGLGPAITSEVVGKVAPNSVAGIASNEAVVITWATSTDKSSPSLANVTPNVTVTNDSTHVATTATTYYGPYSQFGGAASFWAADVGTLPAGTYTYTIKMTDSAGHTAAFTSPAGAIQVAAASPLLVDAPGPARGAPTPLTSAELAPIVAAAEQRLTAALGTQATAGLGGASVQLADLSSGMLGETSGKTVLIDRDAAGYGWFVDPTPSDNAEFAERLGPDTLAAAQDSPAAGRVDLLTTVMHEMGHVLGYRDDSSGDLMDAVLPLGVRRTVAVDEVFASYS